MAHTRYKKMLDLYNVWHLQGAQKMMDLYNVWLIQGTNKILGLYNVWRILGTKKMLDLCGAYIVQTNARLVLRSMQGTQKC